MLIKSISWVSTFVYLFRWSISHSGYMFIWTMWAWMVKLIILIIRESIYCVFTVASHIQWSFLIQEESRHLDSQIRGFCWRFEEVAIVFDWKICSFRLCKLLCWISREKGWYSRRKWPTQSDDAVRLESWTRLCFLVYIILYYTRQYTTWVQNWMKRTADQRVNTEKAWERKNDKRTDRKEKSKYQRPRTLKMA